MKPTNVGVAIGLHPYYELIFFWHIHIIVVNTANSWKTSATKAILCWPIVCGPDFLVFFFLWLLFSGSQVVIFFGEKVIIWVTDGEVCTKMMSFHLSPHLEWKKLSFDDFFITTWETENKSQRKKNQKIWTCVVEHGFLVYLQKIIVTMAPSWGCHIIICK